MSIERLGILSATGKADLPSVVVEVVGAAGQQHVQAIGPLDQGHEH